MSLPACNCENCRKWVDVATPPSISREEAQKRQELYEWQRVEHRAKNPLVTKQQIAEGERK